jgi:hypothetical protein
LGVLRELYGGEILFGIKIVLPGLIDYSDLPKFRGLLVRNHLVEFTEFQRSWVTLIIDAHHETFL